MFSRREEEGLEGRVFFVWREFFEMIDGVS